MAGKGGVKVKSGTGAEVLARLCMNNKILDFTIQR